MNRKAFMAAVIIILLLILVASRSSRVVNANLKTIKVPVDFFSIQAAINSSHDGDTVYIQKGTYVENPVVNKSISLIGEDRDLTFIDLTAGLNVEANNVTITGLTILNGWHGLSLTADYCNISGNKITDSQYGVVVAGANHNSLTRNLFQSIGPSSAVVLSSSNYNLVCDNYIDSCIEGIQMRASSSNNIVIENSITHCQDAGIRLLGEYSPPSWQGPANNTITKNNITSCGYGTTIFVSNKNTISYNNYFSNKVQLLANEDYYLTFGNNRSINLIQFNYWTNYNGTDSNGDGIGDSPYIIDANNRDNYPLIEQYRLEIIQGETPTPLSTASNPQTPTPFSSVSPVSTSQPTTEPSITQTYSEPFRKSANQAIILEVMIILLVVVIAFVLCGTFQKRKDRVKLKHAISLFFLQCNVR
jgi:nitrous oxidase accessory protein